ncbi:MAG: hypothetical protein RIC55_35495 [Pirellulaceae bacterium]
MNPRTLVVAGLCLVGLVAGIDLFRMLFYLVMMTGLLRGDAAVLLRAVSGLQLIMTLIREPALLGSLACFGFALLNITRGRAQPRPQQHYGPPNPQGW